jgi:D-alanyl-D-alanine carboxypeptidase
MQQQQQAVRSQASRRPNVLILLLLALLVAAALTVYSFRDTIFAYWDAPPVDTPVEEPPVDTPVAPVEEPPGSDPVDAEPPAAEEPPTVEEPPAVEKPPAAENPAADTPAAVRQLANGDDLLALVTKETSLGKYEPTDLVTIPAEMGLYDTRYQLRAEAYQQLRAMWEEARDAGVDFYVTSAYRSYATQKRLFNNYAAKHGEKAANKFSARPGQSEHQLGTTVDLAVPGHVLASSFGGTTPGRWLAENAYRYGFIMSYPEGSTGITGYIYEPWHFRYIGVEHAAACRESGLILCQYLEQQPQQWQ